MDKEEKVADEEVSSGVEVDADADADEDEEEIPLDENWKISPEGRVDFLPEEHGGVNGEGLLSKEASLLAISAAKPEAKVDDIRATFSISTANNNNNNVKVVNNALGSSSYNNQGSTDLLFSNMIIKSGYVKKRVKRGLKKNSWQKKWMVLRGDSLSYYRNDKEYECLRVVKLNEILSVAKASSPKEEKAAKWKYVFGVVTKDRTFYFKTTVASSSSKSNGHHSSNNNADSNSNTDEDSASEITYNNPTVSSLCASELSSWFDAFRIVIHHKAASGGIAGNVGGNGSSSGGSGSGSTSKVLSNPNLTISTGENFVVEDGNKSKRESVARTPNFTESGGSSASPFTPLQQLNGMDISSASDNDDTFKSAHVPGSKDFLATMLDATNSVILMQGYLIKLCSKYKKWKRRWFVLRSGGKIYYYKDERVRQH